MTLQQFIEFCKGLSDTAENRENIYEMYFCDSALNEAIYAEAVRLGVDHDATPEPMRASLEAIGLHYGVQVLADW